MDLTISIVNGHLYTTLYEKPQNLYLYLPPHSSHPKRITTGLIYGYVHCIHRLIPIFIQADNNIVQSLGQTDTHSNETLTQEQHAKKALFFHMKYHPEDPPRRLIQHLWQQYVTNPPNEIPLSQLSNNVGIPVFWTD
ncbi:hypothetical protein ACHAW6_000468 [Cyclotella cf. meneghiniana]